MFVKLFYAEVIDWAGFYGISILEGYFNSCFYTHNFSGNSLLVTVFLNEQKPICLCSYMVSGIANTDNSKWFQV